MKAFAGSAGRRRVIALALTWDGARWPTIALPREARAFLKRVSDQPAPPAMEMATLLADDRVREIRVCWVPCLKGGSDVLSAPFPTLDGERINFHAVRMVRFGDILGVIYRRTSKGKK
jgi:hypothetical protein